MPRYDVPKAAPEPLRLVQRLVNTVDLEHGVEWLASPAELGHWLQEAGLAVEKPLGEVALARARELREALRALLRANNGAPPAPGAVSVFNSTVAAARISLELDASHRVRLVPHARGVDGALGGIVVPALEAMLDGRWTRLKACRNCRWAFYDYSRNRSASWCSMLLCGNRLKTRDYRRRKKSRLATSGT
jgi:predicted RNA-binding Zn ribbon-like protein